MRKYTGFKKYLRKFRSSNSHQTIHKVAVEVGLYWKPINTLEELLEFGRIERLNLQWLRDAWAKYEDYLANPPAKLD